MWVTKQQLEPCMEQLTGSGLRKEYDKAVYCHSLHLIYTQSTAGVQPPQDPGEPEGKTASVDDLERDKERIL